MLTLMDLQAEMKRRRENIEDLEWEATMRTKRANVERLRRMKARKEEQAEVGG